MPAKRIKKRIIVSVTNDLVAEYRVYKVIHSLIKFGFDVMLIGTRFTNSLPVNFHFATKRFRMLFSKGPLFYTEYNIRLFFYLLFHKTNVYLSNDLDTLLANYLASKLKKVKLVYDSHELFCEVPELVNRKRVKGVWKMIERKILPKVKYSYTVCDSVATIYNKMYGIKMKTVRNVPLCSGKNSVKMSSFLNQFTGNKIVLYQGVLNEGRGLEYMIKAMKYLDKAVFVIVGSGLIEERLKKLVNCLNLEQKVFFTGKINHKYLSSYTKFADIGISIEENISLNYYYSLPNKLFDYIKAHVPVLVSRFPETEKIVNKYDIGEFIDNHDPKHLAEKLSSILNDADRISKFKNNLRKAAEDLCWENEEYILKEIFNG